MVAIRLEGIVPEIIRMFIVVFGTLSFTEAGSMSVFAAEPDPCPWRQESSPVYFATPKSNFPKGISFVK